MEDRVICSTDVMSTYPLPSKRTVLCRLNFGDRVNVIDSDHDLALVEIKPGENGLINASHLESRSSFKIAPSFDTSM